MIYMKDMKRIYDMKNAIIRAVEKRLFSRCSVPVHFPFISRSAAVVILCILLGFSGNAWAYWSGSGQGTKVGGTWYALYDDGPYEVGVLLGVPTSKTLDLLCPGDKLTFEARRSARTGIGTLQVSDGYSILYDSNPEYDYKSKGSFDVNVNATRLEFKEHSASYKKLFNIHYSLFTVH